ncbi:hypothetical protein [Niabella drilacis]|nr:hypothetical protein [Niabella drilacis]
MPVLLPYGAGKKMLNVGKGMGKTDRMPNLWNKPGRDSNTGNQPFYIRPLYYYPAPLLSARPEPPYIPAYKMKSTKPAYQAGRP